jgi:Uma2 family endonuclease
MMSVSLQFDWTQAYPPGVEPAWEIALLFPPQGGWSVDDYFTLTERTNKLVEFTAGRIEVLEMPTIEHQLIVLYLMDALRAVEQGKRGIALMAPHPTLLGSNRIREPDIVFKLRKNKPRPDERYFQGADLVMEVVSPDKSSHQRDYCQKRSDYAEADVSEYWIVDPQAKRVTVLALENGKYVEHSVAESGKFAESRLLDGFRIDADAVFAAGKHR